MYGLVAFWFNWVESIRMKVLCCCAQQRLETADGDNKRCVLGEITDVRLKGMRLSGQRLIGMRPNGMRPEGMRPNRMRLKGYGSRERGLKECGPTG